MCAFVFLFVLAMNSVTTIAITNCFVFLISIAIANYFVFHQDSTRASETYQCPVYHSRIAPREVVMELDVRREGIPATRWALRGLSATIRPY